MAEDLRQQMQKAKTLIQQKQYTQARRILAAVDHPTARKWEAQLDKLAPPQKRPRRRWRLWLAIVAATLVILAAAIYVGIVLPSQGPAERTRVRGDLADFCIEEILSVAPDVSCVDWSRDVVEAQGSDYRSAVACRNHYPDLDSPFYDCLIDEGVLPPGVVTR